jgi:methyltransferase-like protein/trans-aconitate methyltransferase
VAEEDYFYEALPFAETHPDHLGALGVLFGLSPAPPSRCRFLEIGTATGGNVLPLAAAFPESTFVAIDRAEDSLAVAKSHVEAGRLGNVLVRLADVRDFEDEPASYDYIVCHGVYSWVPDEAREAIRNVVRRHLAPHGLAYISFNTLPGWFLRGSIRDMLRREVGKEGTHAERVERARAFLRFLATKSDVEDPNRTWLASELGLLDALSDHYLVGEHLVDNNRAEYFADFARDIEKSGLAFVADAHVPLMFPERLGSAALEAVRARGGGVVETQQALDYLELRCFRRAVLCRDDAPLDRHVLADRLSTLTVASPLEPLSEAPDLTQGVEESFQGSGLVAGAIGTDQAPLKAALVALARRAPAGLSFDALAVEAATLLGRRAIEAEERARLARNLLGLYTKGALRLWAGPKPVTGQVGERPHVHAWARFQARAGHPILTSLLHAPLPVENFDRALVRRMDGRTTVAELVTGVMEDAATGAVSVSMNGEPVRDRGVFEEIVERKLARLARLGFLVE